jgi:DNA-binding transcriptional LysR family regulator
MSKIVDWDSHIGRRLRLRDLHVFFTVVQSGSMAKAAAQFRVSQPAVSKVIADLEHVVGVCLLDRGPRGVEPTIYGRALLARARGAFDELRQGIRDIEFLGDPTAGELKIGAPESISAAILPAIIDVFNRQYPRVVIQVDDVLSPSFELPKLRDRNYDLVLCRMIRPLANEQNDLNIEILFDDPPVVAAHMQSRWARRRKIDPAELVGEPWILPPPSTQLCSYIAEAFEAHGLAMPKISLIAFSMHLRTNLPASGRFITVFSKSVLRLNGDRYALKALPVDLRIRPSPVAIVTVKNRTLSPVVERFIACAREVTRSLINSK